MQQEAEFCRYQHINPVSGTTPHETMNDNLNTFVTHRTEGPSQIYYPVHALEIPCGQGVSCYSSKARSSDFDRLLQCSFFRKFLDNQSWSKLEITTFLLLLLLLLLLFLFSFSFCFDNWTKSPLRGVYRVAPSPSSKLEARTFPKQQQL